MIKVEALTNFTKHTKAIQGKGNHTKAIQALNEERIQMKGSDSKSDGFKHTYTAQGGTRAII